MEKTWESTRTLTGMPWKKPPSGSGLLAVHRLRRLTAYLGPAFIVSVAYIDPGNFAANISGGSQFNYNLLWVILWSNLMAIFLQNMSARLGIITGRTLPENCRLYFSRPTNLFLWFTAELAAMATDLAEFLGGALGFYLLFHLPMFWGGLLTGATTMFLACLERYGYRAQEYVIAALVGVISIAYVFELTLAGPDWGQVVAHTLIPTLDRESIMVAVAMLGATVMPHVIYLHSALVQPRRKNNSNEELRRHLRMEKFDIAIAMNIAFIINASMVIVSAAVFHTHGVIVDSITDAHRSLAPILGNLSAAAFGVALLASGLSSSAVGTMAGQVIMGGFVAFNIPLWLQRLITMVPAVICIAIGLNAWMVLIVSQVILSFALPAAVIPLMILSSRREVMGTYAASGGTRFLGWTVVALIICFNGILLFRLFAG